MELYILSRQDLSILSISKVSSYEINLDEETNAKSVFTLMNAQGLEKDNFIVLNGLYRQFLFIIDEVQSEKGSNVSTITALDISNLFDRKIIEKNIDTMTTNSIEQFIADTMADNFVNSDDTFLNVGYIDIYWHTNTQGIVATNAENGLYNFHTFLINCRQYKNIYTEFQFVNGRLKIDISYKEETTQLIDTTLPEVTNYNKIHEDDITAKVTVLIREDNSEYNLYLRTDRTTTTDKDDVNRASGKIEVLSVDTADMAPTEALNVMKGNTYKHLVEFKIAKTSKVMDITQLYIGRPIRIKTEGDIYDSYISAITLTDENFVYFKTGSLRETLLDKLKLNKESVGNKLDKTGGVIKGILNVEGISKTNGHIVACSDTVMAYASGQLSINVPVAWTNYKIPLNQAEATGRALTFDSTNKRIVVNEEGYLDIFAQLDVYTDGYVNGDYNLVIFKNGTAYNGIAYEYITSSGQKYYDKLTGQQFGVYANVGDYFELYLTCGGTGTVRTFAGAMTSLTIKYRRAY